MTEFIALDFPQALVDAYAQRVEIANAKALKIKAATEGVDEQIDTFINTSDDEQIANYRQWRDSVIEEIEALKTSLKENEEQAREHARAQVAEELDFDPKELTSEYLADRRGITEMRKGFNQIYGNERTDERLAEVSEVVSLTGTRKGSGSPRPNLESASVDGVTLEKATFGEIANVVSAQAGKRITAADTLTVALKAGNFKQWQDAEGEQTFTLSLAGNDFVITWEPVA